MQYFREAEKLRSETIAHRRYFHRNAETGTNMPLAQEYVLRTLASEGIEAKPCAGGAAAILGQGKHTILLRADMDALPMAEKSGLPFACPTGLAAHTCGHDMHAAMLLTAAKLLKSNENTLRGRVKLMFQTGEETLSGAKQMVAEGILQDPKPDAALALHVGPSGTVGECWYNADSTMMLSCDAFRITVRGKGGHSAYPHLTVDPLGAAVEIYNALMHLAAYEADPSHNTVLTIGSLTAGTAYNIIPETATLQGSIRTDDAQTQVHLKKRMHEIAARTAEAFRCSVEITMLAENPLLRCDGTLTNAFADILAKIPQLTLHAGIRASGSDDFAEITARIPAAYLFLSAGFPNEASFASHNPAVRFNEDVLPLGAAILAHCADTWLRSHD